MTLNCDICSLIPWPWLLWERRCANPLITGSFLSQAGGEERNGNWLWGPPPLPLSLQSQWEKLCGWMKLIILLVYEKDKGFPFPFLWWDSANANCLLLSHNGKLWCHRVCSPLLTTLMHPALWRPLLRLIGIQGCLNSAVTFQERAGQDISRYRLKSGGLSLSLKYMAAHTLGQWDPLV